MRGLSVARLQSGEKGIWPHKSSLPNDVGGCDSFKRGGTVNVNDCHDIKDGSSETFLFLSDLISSSRTDEHMVYRECELDELWRLLLAERALAAAAEVARIDARIAGVVEVHDLLGLNATAATAIDAAARLRALVS